MRSVMCRLIILFYIFNVQAAMADGCPCELMEKKQTIEASLEVLKKDYEQEPSDINLQNLTHAYAKLEEIKEELEKIENS